MDAPARHRLRHQLKRGSSAFVRWSAPLASVKARSHESVGASGQARKRERSWMVRAKPPRTRAKPAPPARATRSPSTRRPAHPRYAARRGRAGQTSERASRGATEAPAPPRRANTLVEAEARAANRENAANRRLKPLTIGMVGRRSCGTTSLPSGVARRKNSRRDAKKAGMVGARAASIRHPSRGRRARHRGAGPECLAKANA